MATWSALTACSGDDRVVGVATAGLALATSYTMLPRGRFRVAALPRLVAFFLVESIRSGLQVAVLALSPRRRPAPTTLDLELGLGDAGSRTALAVLLSVMPGTLAVAVDGSRLTLHVLDARRPAEPFVRRAETLLLRLVGGSDP